MTKDPAFLFYTKDFISGTMFLTDEQVGKYIRLLCAQHEHGHLTEKQILMICKRWDDDIMLKFKQDDEGKYYNLRLELESGKRKKHSEHQRKNIEKRWNKEDLVIPNAYQNDTNSIPIQGMSAVIPLANAIANANANEDENVDKGGAGGKRFDPPDLTDIENFFDEKNVDVTEAEKFFDYYTSNGWKVGGRAVMKDWKAAARNWIKNINNYANTKTSTGRSSKIDYAGYLRQSPIQKINIPTGEFFDLTGEGT